MRDDVEPHQRPRVSRGPVGLGRRLVEVGEQPGHVGQSYGAGGQIDLGHQGLDERHQPGAGVGAQLEQILLGKVDDVGDAADLGSGGVQHPEPDQLAVVVLLGGLGTRVGVDVHHQHGAAQGLDGGPIGIAEEADQQSAAVVTYRLDDEVRSADPHAGARRRA